MTEDIIIENRIIWKLNENDCRHIGDKTLPVLFYGSSKHSATWDDYLACAQVAEMDEMFLTPPCPATPQPSHSVWPNTSRPPRPRLYRLGCTFLCRLRSIATHRDHFVRRPSVRPSVCLSVRPSVTLSKAMFRRRHMHSSECCHYIGITNSFSHTKV